MPDGPYAPAEIARRVETLGVAKAGMGWTRSLPLAGLAGAFISLGCVLYLVGTCGSTLGFGPTRLLGGLAFCLGLELVILAGAELFTGNNLVAMAWASGRVPLRTLLRGWGLVYLGNVLGCLATAALVLAARTHDLGAGEVERAATAVTQAKLGLDPLTAFARGMLCNALVCLAVWLAMGGRSFVDRWIAVLFPVTAFVALGLEHSIANWFFLPYGWALLGAPLEALPGLGRNLLWVTLGNVVGGTLLVGGVYWVIYLRGEGADDPGLSEPPSAA